MGEAQGLLCSEQGLAVIANVVGDRVSVLNDWPRNESAWKYYGLGKTQGSGVRVYYRDVGLGETHGKWPEKRAGVKVEFSGMLSVIIWMDYRVVSEVSRERIVATSEDSR